MLLACSQGNMIFSFWQKRQLNFLKGVLLPGEVLPAWWGLDSWHTINCQSQLWRHSKRQYSSAMFYLSTGDCDAVITKPQSTLEIDHVTEAQLTGHGLLPQR
jgi:hypothetical protein